MRAAKAPSARPYLCLSNSPFGSFLSLENGGASAATFCPVSLWCLILPSIHQIDGAFSDYGRMIEGVEGPAFW